MLCWNICPCCSLSAEKQVRTLLAREAFESLNTQDKDERLTAATRHLFQDVMATLEIDLAGSEGSDGMIVNNIKPQGDRFVFPDIHRVIVLASGRLLI